MRNVTSRGISLSIVLAAGVLIASTTTSASAGNPTEGIAEEQAGSAALAETENDDLVTTIADLEEASVIGANSRYGDLVAQVEVLEDGSVELRYWQGHELADQLVAAAKTVGESTALSLALTPVDFDPKQVFESARELSENDPEVLRSLGLGFIDSVSIDTRTGALTIYGADALVAEVDYEGNQARVETGVKTVLQNRYDDGAPWSGGAVLSMNSSLGTLADCTAGFNWRKWSSNELMGSTAEHCYESSGVSTWYNWGVAVGNRYYYSTSRDTFLMRSSPQNSFNPNVFVGAANTSVIRWVVGGMASEPIGSAIALSGGNSGLNVGTIRNTAFTSGGKGPWRETTVSACQGGDSGGPWLTTLSGSGNVIAHGQHGGVRQYPGGVLRCFYMPVTPISAALSASLHVH